MIKNDRAIDKKELLYFIKNTQGVTATTLINIFGNPKAIYKILSNFVEDGFLNKKKLNRETIYYANDIDIDSLFALDIVAKAFNCLTDFGFIFGSIAYDSDCILLQTAHILDKQEPDFYNFRLYNLNIYNIDYCIPGDFDYIDIIVIDDHSLLSKIFEKQKEGKISKDVLIYSVITNNLYKASNTNNTGLDILGDFNTFKNSYAPRKSLFEDDIKYFTRLYDQKTKNKLKYSRK